MLQTRLWMGSLLAAGGMGLLIADGWLAPWYPGWFLLSVALGIVTCHELVRLLRQRHKLFGWLCFTGVVLVIASNWLTHMPVMDSLNLGPWNVVLTAFVVYFIAVFLVEMATFSEPGEVVTRMAMSIWIVTYLGVLSSFLIQLRWLPDHQGTVALIMAIFVPKCCDIGAYFTGRWFGRHSMTPLLSPKKTWEGAVGGLVVAALITIAVDQLIVYLGPKPLLGRVLWAEIGFGVTVGAAGILGDLAESMIKRDCQQKDASQAVPGFGGVLDVIDAVLFAAPVVYIWLVFIGSYL